MPDSSLLYPLYLSLSLFSKQTKLAVFPCCHQRSPSFPSFFVSYVRTKTHTAADMHKLLHRCLTWQYEHSDLFIFPLFLFSPIPSIFLSSSQFIHEKVSLGSLPEKLHKDKIFYRGERKFIGRERFSCIYRKAMNTSGHGKTAIETGKFKLSPKGEFLDKLQSSCLSEMMYSAALHFWLHFVWLKMIKNDLFLILQLSRVTIRRF